MGPQASDFSIELFVLSHGNIDIGVIIMAGIGDFFESPTGGGVVVGLAAAVLTPVIVPILVSVAKPLLKSAIKSGIFLYEKGKETAAEISEMVDDVAAEARSEMAGAHAGGGTAAMTEKLTYEEHPEREGRGKRGADKAPKEEA